MVPGVVDGEALRIGQAAGVLGVSVETLRRWEDDGSVRMERSAGGQRRVPLAEVKRLLDERRRPPAPVAAQSARNQLDAVVTGVRRGSAAAAVEMQAGPYRLVALVTAESVDELDLAPGRQVVATVKATNVIVGLPGEASRQAP